MLSLVRTVLVVALMSASAISADTKPAGSEPVASCEAITQLVAANTGGDDFDDVQFGTGSVTIKKGATAVTVAKLVDPDSTSGAKGVDLCKISVEGKADELYQLKVGELQATRFVLKPVLLNGDLSLKTDMTFKKLNPATAICETNSPKFYTLELLAGPANNLQMQNFLFTCRDTDPTAADGLTGVLLKDLPGATESSGLSVGLSAGPVVGIAIGAAVFGSLAGGVVVYFVMNRSE